MTLGDLQLILTFANIINTIIERIHKSNYTILESKIRQAVLREGKSY